MFSKTSCTLLLLLAMAQLHLQALPIESGQQSASCFDDFINSTADASNDYEASYKTCAEIGAATRLVYTRDYQTDRKQMQQIAAVVCARMEQCNAMTSDLDYFDCHAKAGPANTSDMVSIKLNATVVLIQLDQSSSDAEKAIQLCNVVAQRVYIDASKQAHEELISCLAN